MLEHGIAYGKGLQLVNILRDLPADLADGTVLSAGGGSARYGRSCWKRTRRWLERATGWVDEGFAYAGTLRSRRLRAATVLPAMIARDLGTPARRGLGKVATTRQGAASKVYLALLRAFAGKTAG